MKIRFSQIATGAFLIAGAVSATALAMGVLNPLTKDQGVSYVDADYLGGGAIVSAARRSAGSGSEQFFEVQIKLPAGAGSLTEDAFFVGFVGAQESLPTEVLINPANENYEPLSNEAAGAIGIDQFDQTLLKGDLFGYDLEALPQRPN